MSVDVTLKTSDGVIFKVERKHIMISNTISGMLQDCDVNDVPISLIKTTSHDLRKIIGFARVCEGKVMEHLPNKLEERCDVNLLQWQRDWATVMFSDTETYMSDLFSVIRAANHMDIPLLFHVCMMLAVEHCKGKEFHEMRKLFNIKTTFSTVQKKAVISENQWLQWSAEQKCPKRLKIADK